MSDTRDSGSPADSGSYVAAPAASPAQELTTIDLGESHAPAAKSLSGGGPALPSQPEVAKRDGPNARWWHLAMFVPLTCINACMWITFAPIADIVATKYGVSMFAVDQLSTIFMYMFVPCSPLAAMVDARMGMRTVVLTGALLNALGAWVRTVGAMPGRGFGFLFLGATITAISQAFILSVPPRLAAVWFRPSERGLASGIGVMANLSGTALGMLFPSLLVEGPEDIFQLNGLHATWSTAVALVIALGFRAAPVSPPSLSAQRTAARLAEPLAREDTFGPVSPTNGDAEWRGNDSSQEWLHQNGDGGHGKSNGTVPPGGGGDGAAADGGVVDLHRQRLSALARTANRDSGGGSSARSAIAHYLGTVWRLMRDNRSFRLITLSYGLLIGSMYTVATTINPILSDNFGGDDSIGWAGVVLTTPGLPCVVLLGLVLDRSRAFKSLFLVGSVGTCVSMIVLAILVSVSPSDAGGVLIMLSLACLGATSAVVTSVGFELAAELSYPVPEILSGGIINTSSQVFGIVLVSSVDWLRELITSQGTAAVLCVMMAIAAVMSVLISPQYARDAVDAVAEAEVEAAAEDGRGSAYRYSTASVGAGQRRPSVVDAAGGAHAVVAAAQGGGGHPHHRNSDIGGRRASRDRLPPQTLRRYEL